MKKDITFLQLFFVFAIITTLVVFVLFPYLDKGIGIDTSYDRLSFGVLYLVLWLVIFAYFGVRKLFYKKG